MRVTVLYFAQARDRTGCASEPLELADGSCLADALAAIRAQHPSLATLWPHLAIALDGALVHPGSALGPGAEIALLPPVSGGSEP